MSAFLVSSTTSAAFRVQVWNAIWNHLVPPFESMLHLDATDEVMIESYRVSPFSSRLIPRVWA